MREATLSRGGLLDPVRIDMERMWAEEKNDLELEITRLKERLKVVEDQASRDVSVIAMLEERLMQASPVATATEDKLDAEDLNDELNTTRKDLYISITKSGRTANWTDDFR